MHVPKFLIGAVTVTLLSGCLSVPKDMQVRSGASPFYADDNVRFRTTYYFRVLSLCGDGSVRNDDINNRGVQIDSLYRFRMTGKAGALANKIHFESGFLHKDVIDPLGVIVNYDSKNNRFFPSSQDNILRDSNRRILMNQLHEYVELLPENKRNLNFAETEVENLIKKQLTELEALNPILPGSTQDSSASSTNPSDDPGSPASKCGGIRYGFQVLGPQGMQTYDQNQRLILAMSSSAKPLVSTLKELAARMMPRPGNNTEALLLITKERLKLSNAERELYRLENELGDTQMSPSDFVGKITSVLNPNKIGSGENQ